MKYIVIEVKLGNELKMEVPFVFPNNVVHSSMIIGAIAVCKSQKWDFQGVISAGEVLISASNCGGKSVSSNLESRGHEDACLINMVDYSGGFK